MKSLALLMLILIWNDLSIIEGTNNEFSGINIAQNDTINHNDSLSTWNTKDDIIILDNQKTEINIETTLNSDVSEKIVNIPNKKNLDIKFYTQFPIWIFSLPFREYCEEASILGGLYYLNGVEPSIDIYVKDLHKIRDIEEKLYWEGWYKNTSIDQTHLILYLFQNPEFIEPYFNAKTQIEKNKIQTELTRINKERWKVMWRVIENPSTLDLMKEINYWNPIVVPVNWRNLKNIYFTQPWPLYHNILLKWYDEENFIFSEVWTTRWENYIYKKSLIMNNIHDVILGSWPDDYILWASKVLVLYK